MACGSEERGAAVAATKNHSRVRLLAKLGSSKALCFTPKPPLPTTFLHPGPPLLAAAKGHPEQPRSTREGSSGRRTHRPSLLKAFATIDGTSLGGLERNRRFLPTL